MSEPVPSQDSEQRGPRAGRGPRRGTVLVVVAVVMALAAAIIIAVLVVRVVSSAEAVPAGPQAGDCVVPTQGASSAALAIAACDDPAAVYRVGLVDEPCPRVEGTGDGSYTVYTERLGRGDDVTERMLCLAPNLTGGSCYEVGSGVLLASTDCAAPAVGLTSFEVALRTDGATTDVSCPPGTVSRIYPEPPVLYCLAPLPAQG